MTDCRKRRCASSEETIAEKLQVEKSRRVFDLANLIYGPFVVPRATLFFYRTTIQTTTDREVKTKYRQPI
jgi:hypothetical protein